MIYLFVSFHFIMSFVRFDRFQTARALTECTHVKQEMRDKFDIESWDAGLKTAN